MKRTLLVPILVSAIFPPAGSYAQVPAPAHVVIVMEENHDYAQIIGSAAAPYINALAGDTHGALFTQSYALTHPSQPNYLMLYSGSNQGVVNDNLPSGLPFTTPNLGASLMDSGWTFAGYSEDLPYAGFEGTSSGAYARKHNPWANWQSAPVNGIPVGANLPLTGFPTDLDSLPTVSFVIPNQDNDMHNGSDPATITTGDTWLRNHLDGYIQWAKTHNSLFVLTFDEGTNSGSNRIVTLFVGSMVRQGAYNETINHYSVLRTLENMFGLPHAAGSLTASPIVDCWVSLTDISGGKGRLPENPVLMQNFPNPFNPSTTIPFSIPRSSEITLKVLDVLGREVVVLANEQRPAGTYTVTWDASHASSGVYFYRLDAGGYGIVKKLLLLK